MVNILTDLEMVLVLSLQCQTTPKYFAFQVYRFGLVEQVVQQSLVQSCRIQYTILRSSAVQICW